MLRIDSHKEVREVFIWTTQEGVRWKLKDMHDNHIQNCIRHQQKRISYYQQVNLNSMVESIMESVEIFKKEVKFRRKLKLLEIFKNEII